VNRAAFIAAAAAIVFAAAALFVLTTRAPDDAGEGRRPDAAAVSDLPPRPDAPSPREASEPPPRAPEPPAPPSRPPRKRSPASAAGDPPPASVSPSAATLRVTSDVSGAQVFLNREFVGNTPATAENLAPGSYQLNVAAPGFDAHVETLELAAGEREVTVNFRVIRLNASIDVVHKHRFGSCKGTLTASPEGIRYETADRDDAFAAALLALDTFQVDYLNKNLRVQPRKGKRYDFTDPDGNADRLFVFHRDVERVREQLKKGETQ
jgi:hypothetical protein